MKKRQRSKHRKQELITFNIQDELEESEDERDQIEIKLSSSSIQIPYYQLCKYSQLIEDQYQKLDAGIRLTQDIKRIQEDYDIEDDNIITFFNIMKEGNIELLSHQFRDLFILAEYFKVKFLEKFLDRYTKTHFNDINVVINMIMSSKSDTTNEKLQNDQISSKMEQLLSEKIDECIQNENFGKLPISKFIEFLKKVT